jgi:hypothetical protein
MVKVGKHTVALIYADTKKPFKEHTASDGQVYVEVEPNAEYYIHLSTDSQDVVVMRIKVDGKDLGYQLSLNKANCMVNPNYFCGVSSVDESGGTIHQALKFAKTPVMQKTEDNKVPPAFWTGSVQVEFYEGVYHGVESNTRAFRNSWTGAGNDVGYMIGKSNPDQKKGVMSAAGSTRDYTQPSAGKRARYATGGHLKTITLNYCSTVGLIFAGILTKPPLWEWGQMIKPGVQVS